MTETVHTRRTRSKNNYLGEKYSYRTQHDPAVNISLPGQTREVGEPGPRYCGAAGRKGKRKVAQPAGATPHSPGRLRPAPLTPRHQAPLLLQRACPFLCIRGFGVIHLGQFREQSCL